MKHFSLLSSLVLAGSLVAFAGTPRKQSTVNPASELPKQANLITAGLPSDGSKTLSNETGTLVQSPNRNHIPNQQMVFYTDNMDGANDTTALKARGYKVYYRGGGPPGTTAMWFQGNAATFPAYNGPTNGYVASNYNSVTATNNIDNWLVLPALNVAMGDIFSFYSRSVAASTFPDSIKVMYAASGDSTPEQGGWVMLDNFVVNTAGMWELKSYNAPAGGANARFAIRYAVVNGGPTGLNSDFIGIDQIDVYTASAIDAKTDVISSPVSGCSLTATETVTIRIVNSGATAYSNFDVGFDVDGGTPSIETIANTMNPGDTLVHTFAAAADLSAAGMHVVRAWVSVTGDGISGNDTASASVTNASPANPVGTPYTMGFEPGEDLSGWFVVDGNTDGTSWALVNAIAHTGDWCIRKAGSGSDDDDWLFTSCLDLAAGTNYALSYWYKNFELLNPCSLEVYIGTAQDPSTMSQLIIQHPIPADTTYQPSLNLFSVSASGVYYIGFHGYSFQGTGTSSLRIDDINLVDEATAINEVSNNLQVSIYPNPNSGMFYLNSKSAVKDATVEVFNTVGQRVFTKSFGSLAQQKMDLSHLTKGWYMVRITTGTYAENQTVLISK